MSHEVFVVTVAGEMDGVLGEHFDDLALTVGHGVSRVCVTCPDPSVLHGILNRLTALGLELLDVRTIDGMPDM